MDNRKQATIDFKQVKTAKQLIDTFAELSSEKNPEQLKEAFDEFENWYGQDSRNLPKNINHWTAKNFLELVAYALTTNDINKLDPKMLKTAIEKFTRLEEKQIPEKTKNCLLVLCKVLEMKQTGSPASDILSALRQLPKDSFVNLRGLDLSGTTLKIRPDLSGFNLMGLDLSKCDFSLIGMRKTNLLGTNLSNSRLNGIDLSSADLSGANLQKTDFSNANLTGTRLVDVDLSTTILKGTNLDEVVLLSPDSFENLEEAILKFHETNKNNPEYNQLLLALAKNITREANQKKREDPTLAAQWIDTGISLAEKLSKSSSNKDSSLFAKSDITDTLQELKQAKTSLQEEEKPSDNLDAIAKSFAEFMKKKK